MTGILQIDHSLTTQQAQQLASLVESRFDAKSRIAFPILEPSYPLFVLTKRELQTILPFDVANAVYSQVQSVKKTLKTNDAQENASKDIRAGNPCSRSVSETVDRRRQTI